MDKQKDKQSFGLMTLKIEAGMDFKSLLKTKECVIIADENISQAEGLGFPCVKVRADESSKSAESALELIDTLLAMNVHRGTTLVAIGGGIITDLVGFIASVYMRGLPLILIPTTLLAMVDAAIGGKTAINTKHGKNLIGTIYPPEEIWIDFIFLKTLPEKEYQNGLAEIWKLGLAYDSSLFCEKPDIERAIHAQVEITSKDPTEKGLRRILNFGHTVAHALERASGYEIAHGYAVLIGSLVESHLSCTLGYLSNQEFDKIEKMYQPLHLKLPNRYTRKELLEAMQHDKKSIGTGPRFVLIDKIGHTLEFDGHYCRAVTEKELNASLDWMEQRCQDTQAI